jgi:methylmalonyl-CoA mutase
LDAWAAADPGLPGAYPFVRGARAEGGTDGGWDVRQLHTHDDPAAANAAILADLEHGVSSLWLDLPAGTLDRALAGVHLDLAPVALETSADDADPEAAARELLDLHERRGTAPDAARGTLGLDPLGRQARTGRESTADPAALARRCADGFPLLRALVVDTLPYHEAGASPGQELGCALATGTAYLRELTAAGLPVDAALAQLEFRFAVGADQFTSIATLRAARRLWARVAEVCGAGPKAGAQSQHAVTSPVMMTRRDPWVNLLRTTVATLAAGVGGADAVTVLPFDSELGAPDAFARRIARNTSAILLEESHLGRVIDPAGGSWYVEHLTADLARAGWAFFQEIERAGGQAAALRSGFVGERLAATWEIRRKALATRREPITGVSEFPNLAEPPVVRDPAPVRHRASAAGAAGDAGDVRDGGSTGALPVVRRAEAYEALRARSDAHLAATGARPRILLAALGPAAAHTARTSFATNLFQAGGIEPVHDPVTVDAGTVAAALAAAGTTAACVCSSDPVYAEQAADVAAALRAAGATRVLLAGRPGEHREAWTAAGVDTFVSLGGDAVATLTGLLDDLGVA